MPRRPLLAIAVGLLVGACGSASPTTAPTSVPTVAAPTVLPTVAPTAAPTTVATPQATGPFAGQAYSLDLPAGWMTFDLADPSGQTALDAFVKSNPDFGAAIETFKRLPNVTMAINPLVGNVIVALSLPTGGLPLDTIATQFTSQFKAVPGIKEPPVAEDVTLPAGPAVHWRLVLEGNRPGGGTFEVGESIYLIANSSTAVLVEFVETGPAGVPQEQQIIQSLKFTP